MKLIINILKVIGLILLSLLCNIIPMILLQRQFAYSLPLKWGLGIAYIVFIAAIIYFLWKAHKKHEDAAVAQQKFTWKDFGFALFFFLLARVVGIGGTLLNQQLSGQTTTANDAGLLSLSNFFAGGFFLYTLLYVIAVGIIGPIIEELAYRAFPDHLFFKHDHKLLAGVVTTAVFAFPHATTVFEFLMYACLGAVLYLAYQRRGNIKDSMLVHILNNLPSAIYLLLMAFN
ncbi:CPBP family intramembrane glutamic endopeptidase [Streptococcus caviae]|uniref:CPBP family intramembrane glutamic endopeptidase n=1 Tax=Streptococcus sp. 'caviae' TaxID=1915004 RepID=UPI00094BB328|nr:type II CAAX endopeptidase family protein [Streptococcus sp. 'caviae']OLN84141.1 CAAX protease family protein [Streptococcus sp. 'caviae']